MRVARRHPLVPAFSLPALAAAAFAVMLCAVAVFAVRTWRGGGQTAPAGIGALPLTMADSFGLGGLPSLAAPNPGGGALPSPVERDVVVSYYGNPQTPSMGLLGQHPPEEAADLLAERAAAFRFLTRSYDVLPALQVVYAVAQPVDGDGSLAYLDDRSVRQMLALARRRGFAVILDLQIGHSDALAEVQRIAPYLEEPDVFVALDPEFALPGSTQPGERVGSIDAADINAVQAYLADFSREHRLPKKLLVVHQFESWMITDPSSIGRRNDVDLLIDMDGYGPADIKEAKYHSYGAAPYAPYGGIKVFLQHDPDPMSEAALLGLTPRPRLFVYQ